MQLFNKKREVIEMKIGSLTRAERTAMDVKSVRKWARFLIEVGGKGLVTKIFENPDWKLNVLAVVGPGIDAGGKKYDDAVLFELGMYRSRPYKGTNKNKKDCVHPREKMFFLNEAQYLSVRPMILDLIRQLAAEKISRRKRKLQIVMFRRIYYSRNDRCSYIASDPAAVMTGVRFSISVSDQYALSDIMNFELRNPAVTNKLEKIARFSDLAVKGKLSKKTKGRAKNARYVKANYKKQDIERWENSKSSGIKAIVDSLRIDENGLMMHHLAFLLRSKIIFKKDLFLGIVSKVLDVRSYRLSSEIAKTERMLRLLSFENLDALDIQVRTVPKSCKNGVHVFEVAVPSLVSPEERKAANDKVVAIKLEMGERRRKKKLQIKKELIDLSGFTKEEDGEDICDNIHQNLLFPIERSNEQERIT